MGEPPADDQFATPDEVREALNASGYLLEVRIARALERSGFFIEPSSFRSDPRDPSKSIEVDVSGRFGERINDEDGSITVAEVLVECKNNSQPVAFFMSPQAVREINDSNIKYSGFPVSSADLETKLHVPIHKLLSMSDWHHYCQAQKVAAQFCGFTRDQSAESQKPKVLKRPLERADWCWKAEAMENYSKSFSSLCVATEMAGIGSSRLDHQSIDLEFYYPIIVFQGPIYEIRHSGDTTDVRRTDHLQFHHAASIANRIIRAQIDVVSETGFPKVIDTVQKELHQIANGVRSHAPRLLASAIDQKRVARERQMIASGESPF